MDKGIARRIKNLQIKIDENSEVSKLKEEIVILKSNYKKDIMSIKKDITDLKKVKG
ncbi:MAG: hypothetical protein PHW73_01225 [Atribacterota bacterium]|nr:hypothetical protein [Atribacterota bacterium]